MRFAIINDIHNGPPESGFAKGVQRKLTFRAESLIKQFVEEMNTSLHPEFVVNLGDFIEDVNDRETDLAYFKKTHDLFAPLKAPLYSLIGNHDLRTLTDEDMRLILGYERLYYSFDHGAFHFICLSFTMTGNHRENLLDIKAEFLPDQLEWLAHDLRLTDKPVVVFVHYGLADDDMQDNFWFDTDPQYAFLENRSEVRELLEKSGKVKAVISGHQHWNRMKVHNGIPYFVITSLVENFRNDGVATEAHTVVDLDEEKIVVEVKGNDPAIFSYTFST